MNKPDLGRMWETFILVESKDWFAIQRGIRKQIATLFPRLLESNEIDWYQFLIHDRNSGGIPIPPTDTRLYYHIRYCPTSGAPLKLPDYCQMTRTIVEPLTTIAGIDDSALVGTIEDAWWIIGEQSQFIIDLFNIYKAGDIPIQQVAQFLHFFRNMTQTPIG